MLFRTKICFPANQSTNVVEYFLHFILFGQINDLVSIRTIFIGTREREREGNFWALWLDKRERG